MFYICGHSLLIHGCIVVCGCVFVQDCINSVCLYFGCVSWFCVYMFACLTFLFRCRVIVRVDMSLLIVCVGILSGGCVSRCMCMRLCVSVCVCACLQTFMYVCLCCCLIDVRLFLRHLFCLAR